MIRLNVHGASGRLGRVIVECAKQTGKFDVTGSGRKDDVAIVASKSDVIVDVSEPDGSLAIATACVRTSKPLVIGTTGHSADQVEALYEASAATPILIAPNFSIGVNLLFWLTQRAASVLGSEFDTEIVELHHRLKKDAPSGTARRLAEVIAEARDLDYTTASRHGRKGIVGERTPTEIGIHAVRGGDVVGEHTVYFAGTGERIELTHRATNREIFANGALRAATWLLSQSAGWYDMQDALGLK
jgi:4-hydroxy-tetrahydrodipicolinate reductase